MSLSADLLAPVDDVPAEVLAVPNMPAPAVCVVGTPVTSRAMAVSSHGHVDTRVAGARGRLVRTERVRSGGAAVRAVRGEVLGTRPCVLVLGWVAAGPRSGAEALAGVTAEVATGVCRGAGGRRSSQVADDDAAFGGAGVLQ